MLSNSAKAYSSKSLEMAPSVKDIENCDVFDTLFSSSTSFRLA